MVNLDDVLTITEVMVFWRKSRQGVLNAIYSGGPRRLVARRSGFGPRSTWLIEKASVVRRWGPPMEVRDAGE